MRSGASLPSVRCKRDLRAKHVQLRVLQVVQRSLLCDRRERERSVERAGLALVFGGDERAACTRCRIDRQLGRALHERGRGGNTAARRCSPGRKLQLRGDILVRARRGLRAVPRVTVGIDGRVGCLRERAVGLAPVLGRCRSIDGGAHERVWEHDARTEVQQSLGLDRRRRRFVDAELFSRAPDEQGVAGRFGRGDEQQAPTIRRDARESLGEVFLDPSGQRDRCGQPEPTGELGRRHAARQLQQRERIAVRLDDDPVEHPLIDASRQDGLQQDPCITPSQGTDVDLGEAGKRVASLAGREHERDLLGEQPAREERQRASRRIVQPLRVVDHAEQRARFGHLRQQTEDGKPDEERIGRRADGTSERDGERVALGIGQAIGQLDDR